MASAFTVSVDVSKLNLTTPPVFYHVFVDPSQMGIVLEFMELVRYLWDLKDTVILTHNNACIHYLEDIRILSLFKHVEIEYFTPSQSETIRMKNLLEKLKFFHCSMDQDIPRIIFSRFEKNPDSKKETSIVTNSDSSELHCNKRLNCNGVKQNPTSTDPHLQKIKDSALANLNNWCSSSNVRTISTSPKNQTTELLKIQDSEKSNGACSSNNIIQKPAQAPQTNLKRNRSQNLKPFSIGEMLSALRSSSSQDGNSASADEKLNGSTMNENELQEEEEDSLNNTSPNKKRKRIRKHRPRRRKQNEHVSTPFNLNPEVSPNFTKCFQSYANTSNSNHVRFDNEGNEYIGCEVIDDTGNESTGEVTTQENPNEEAEKAGDNPLGRSLEINEEENTVVKKMDLDLKPFKNNSRVVSIVESLDSETDDKSKSLRVDQLSTLLTFKKNNVSPVAYRRVEVVSGKNPFNFSPTATKPKFEN